MDGRRQIYAAASNENTYTNLWTRQFYGFRLLRETLKNTETPRRLKPINVYYHIYAGERLASLNALIQTLGEVGSQEILPVWTSTYVRMAQGFYSTRFVELAPRSWRIEDRGDLQTIRFDHAQELSVDQGRSSGVLGWRHHQGSLYVVLDPVDKAPVITLGPRRQDRAGMRPALIQSSWLIEDLRLRDDGFSFQAGGLGPGRMLWQVRLGGTYRLSFERDGYAATETVAADGEGVLSFELPAREPEKRPVELALQAPSHT
ncbi:hypothetical protein [Jiella pacifica]|uniref:Uncharacterized protein n=1 Tax=Jiella pacifica TaxID=2696469 RepID=A0A6N9TBN0_9HYPH|nr:hypothetical protein [Jiella pacifica]NDW07982.1 hypothetical protein [Jiella pacifica]